MTVGAPKRFDQIEYGIMNEENQILLGMGMKCVQFWSRLTKLVFWKTLTITLSFDTVVHYAHALHDEIGRSLLGEMTSSAHCQILVPKSVSDLFRTANND